MKKSSAPSKKKWVITAAVVAVLIIAGGAFALQRHNATELKNQQTALETPDSDYNKIDYSPATEEDKAKNDDIKQDLPDNNTTPPPAADKVNVVIVDAAQYNSAVEVRAFVSDAVIASGTCTYTFTNGAEKVTKTSTAIPDATSTRCPNISVPTTEFNKSGTWNLTVSFSSANATGSATKGVEISK